MGLNMKDIVLLPLEGNSVVIKVSLALVNVGQALILNRNSCLLKHFLRAPFFAIASDHEN